MFNLAHIYFYEESGVLDLDKAFKLMVNTYSFKINCFLELLCLIVIKKYDMIFDDELLKDFIKIDEKTGGIK